MFSLVPQPETDTEGGLAYAETILVPQTETDTEGVLPYAQTILVPPSHGSEDS